ncbi:MAG: hypothetical protein SPD54_07120 [Parabacteroides sp.]|nr:hypothetical protein [Parabacteroides sp.]
MTNEKIAESELLKMLKNLERMFVSAQQCLNEYARDALLKALAIEAETLTLKMQAMLTQWKWFLPFKEACDVEFDVWEGQVGHWLVELQNSLPCIDNQGKKFIASASFLFDLYLLWKIRPAQGISAELESFLHWNNLPINLPSGEFRGHSGKSWHTNNRQTLETIKNNDDDCLGEISRYCVEILKEDIKTQCDSISKKQSLGTDDWGAQEGVEELFKTNDVNFRLNKQYYIRSLYNLYVVLSKISAYTKELWPDVQLRRLSYFVISHYCQNLGAIARKKVSLLVKPWPQSTIKDNVQQQKELLQAQLMKNKWGQKLEKYIDFNDPQLSETAGFGWFLYENRHILEIADVRAIYKICSEICEWNKLIYPDEEQLPDLPAMPRQLNNDEQKILDQLMELAEKGDWTQGATVESIQAGLKRALGVGDPLPKELQSQSEQLWVLLKKRDGCDADKSLRVTWLNIAGWSVKKGVLKCMSSPSLCKSFFEDCGEHDYKAIDKGRENPSKRFGSIFKLLETCLLPKQS